MKAKITGVKCLAKLARFNQSQQRLNPYCCWLTQDENSSLFVAGDELPAMTQVLMLLS